MEKEKTTANKSSSRLTKKVRETPSYTPLKANKQGYSSTPLKLSDDINRELESPHIDLQKNCQNHELVLNRLRSFIGGISSNQPIESKDITDEILGGYVSKEMKDFRYSPLVKRRTLLAIQYQMKVVGLQNPLALTDKYPAFNIAIKKWKIIPRQLLYIPTMQIYI